MEPVQSLPQPELAPSNPTNYRKPAVVLVLPQPELPQLVLQDPPPCSNRQTTSHHQQLLPVEEEERRVPALVHQSPTSWRRAPVEEPEVRQPGALPRPET